MTRGGRGRAAGVQGDAASMRLDGPLGVTGEEFYYGEFTHQSPFPSPFFVVSAPRAENTMCGGSRTVAKRKKQKPRKTKNASVCAGDREKWRVCHCWNRRKVPANVLFISCLSENCQKLSFVMNRANWRRTG